MRKEKAGKVVSGYTFPALLTIFSTVPNLNFVKKIIHAMFSKP